MSTGVWRKGTLGHAFPEDLGPQYTAIDKYTTSYLVKNWDSLLLRLDRFNLEFTHLAIGFYPMSETRYIFWAGLQGTTGWKWRDLTAKVEIDIDEFYKHIPDNTNSFTVVVEEPSAHERAMIASELQEKV